MEEIVFMGSDNQALTNSLLVAKTFEKEHKDVIRAIRNIINTTAQNCAFVENQQVNSMFDLTEQKIPMPNNTGFKRVPLYIMNRDGFTMLAMRFTGAKALKFQLKYIQAFNDMERKLKEPKKIEFTQEEGAFTKEFCMSLFGLDVNGNYLN